jgi:hypothetical protein
MEIVGIGLSTAGCRVVAYAPSRQASFEAGCQNNEVAAGLLVGLGVPILANGAWMWPVGGKLVPAENPVPTFSVVPYLSAAGDGGSLGMKLTFF